MGMYIVSGCPRSGTSLMMNCLVKALGEKRLVGYKFPQEHNRNLFLQKSKNETDNQYQMRLFIDALNSPKIEEDMKQSKDMNPNGFYEHPKFSVSGLHYKRSLRKEIKDINESELPKFAKIVSQGLLDTDPNFVDKIIFMLREPYSVAKSQERLKRNEKYIYEGEEIDLLENITVHTPEMFIKVNLQAAQFILENPNIPILFIEYDDLIENPERELLKVQDFLQDGDFTESIKLIDPKLRRSKDQILDNSLWEDAELVYEKFKEQDFQNLIHLFKNKEKEYNKLNSNWLCLRYNELTMEGHCKTCQSSVEFRNSLKKHAESNNINWKDLPCTYECINKDVSIEDSIKNNFWL